MKNHYKVRILLIGPPNSGKSRIANYLSDVNLEVPKDMQPTETLRILEYDINDLDINGTPSNIDVQLWDIGGNERCTSYWPVFRKNADGIVFLNGYDESAKSLEYMYNYFVTQQNFSLRACLVCTLPSTDNSTTHKLGPVFSKVAHITVNLESNAEKFRQEFSKYITSVVNTLNY